VLPKGQASARVGRLSLVGWPVLWANSWKRVGETRDSYPFPDGEERLRRSFDFAPFDCAQGELSNRKGLGGAVGCWRVSL